MKMPETYWEDRAKITEDTLANLIRFVEVYCASDAAKWSLTDLKYSWDSRLLNLNIKYDKCLNIKYDK